MEKTMVAKTVIKVIMTFVIAGLITNSFPQSIFQNFDLSSDEKCYISSSPADEETVPKFSKRERNGNLYFKICSEEFVHTKGDLCETRKRDELKISNLEDLYTFENEILAKQVRNDSVVKILFKNEIDSVFIAERLDDQLVKVYAVKWVEKIE